MGDDRPATYIDGDYAIYRASAVGHACIKSLVAARLGYTPLPVPASLQVKFDEGTELEPVVIDRLEREYGWSFAGLQDELEIPVGSRIRIRLHPDAALATNPDVSGEFCLEVKNFGDSWWERWQQKGMADFPGYAWQMTLEMVATDRMGLFVVAKKFSDDPLSITVFEEPPVNINVIKAWVLKAEAAVRAAQAGGDMPVCDKDMWPCPFLYLHDADDAHRDDIVVDEALDALAATHQHGADLEAQGKQIKADVRARILDALGTDDKKVTAQWRVQRVVQQRSSLDMEALKAAVDVTPFERKTPVEQLRIKEVGAA